MPIQAATRWAGIDEAGYGPNLGPLVMTCVVADFPGLDRPDLWRILAQTIDRAGGNPACLWVDDSKRLFAAGRGFARLEQTALAAITAATGRSLDADDLQALFEAAGAGGIAEVELDRWLDPNDVPAQAQTSGLTPAARPLVHPSFRIVDVRAVVIGPALFNRWLAETGNKARVHFRAFRSLIEPLWQSSADHPVSVLGDKHGGRDFYYELLLEALGDAWIDRGEEGPRRSAYTARSTQRRMQLVVQPKADTSDGLVALASIVSKYLRERWMQVFNAHWQRRVPGLRPTAGYPVDAVRFRRDLERQNTGADAPLESWWRLR